MQKILYVLLWIVSWVTSPFPKYSVPQNLFVRFQNFFHAGYGMTESQLQEWTSGIDPAWLQALKHVTLVMVLAVLAIVGMVIFSHTMTPQAFPIIRDTDSAYESLNCEPTDTVGIVHCDPVQTLTPQATQDLSACVMYDADTVDCNGVLHDIHFYSVPSTDN